MDRKLTVRRWFGPALAAIALLPLLLSTCSEEAGENRANDPAGDLEPGTPSFGVYNTLKATGSQVTVEGEVQRPFFDATGHKLRVAGEVVEVYEFDSKEDTDAAAATIAPDGSVAGQPAWTTPVRFYKTDRTIVFYPGADPNVHNALDMAVGRAFAGR